MRLHYVAIGVVNIIGLLLVMGMLLGGEILVPRIFHIDRTVRDLSIALWTFIIPAWFTIEAVQFAPRQGTDAARAEFYEKQRVGQMWATAVGTIVAIILGLSSLPANESAAAFQKQYAGTH